MYISKPELPSRVASAFGPLYKLSLNKFYFDEIYTALIVAPLRGLAWLSNWFDQNIIDPIVDGVGAGAAGTERRAAVDAQRAGAVVRADHVARAVGVCAVCDADVAFLDLR